MKTSQFHRIASADFLTEPGIAPAYHSHSIVSDGRKQLWILDLCILIIILYRHFYRLKTSAFAGAGDGLGLTGDYPSPSIVNYRCELARLNIWIIRRY
jgi:hypothetical protein